MISIPYNILITMLDQQQQINSPSSLPIHKYRQQIIQAIRDNSVLIICGDTGSGKTTQVPQFMYQYFQRIIISQPRRISAITLAERVAEEMGFQIGEEVGYNVRFQQRRSRDTKIIFATDGMAIRELMTGTSYDLFILDEAHERSINTDVLMAILHKRLQNNAAKRERAFKLIIMSATIESSKFMRYFNTDAVINIEGRSYETEVFNLVEPVESYVEAMFNTILQIYYQEAQGDVLVFLTGQDEIVSLQRRLQKTASEYSLKLQVLMLYSALPHEYQHRIFERKDSSDTRRIILATNIAETSVTIPGVRYVVDCGFMKVRTYDNQKLFDILSIVPVSKANALQRSGRAGRQAPGKCFRLYLKNSYEELKDQNTPEILRSELSGPLLQLKAIGVPRIRDLSFMDQPKEQIISACLSLLRQIKCISPEPLQDITQYGRQVSTIPLPPRLSHLLLLSLQYKCEGLMLSMMSILSIDNLFLSTAVAQRGNRKTGLYQVLSKYQPVVKSVISTQSKNSVPQTLFSDHLAKINILQEYVAAKNKQLFCKQNFINSNNIKRAIMVREQLEEYLEQIVKERRKKEFFKLDDQKKSLLNSQIEKCKIDEQAVKQWTNCMAKGCAYSTAKLTKQGKYSILGSGQIAQIHPESICFYMSSKPSLIVFSNVVRTNKVYLKDVTPLPQ